MEKKIKEYVLSGFRTDEVQEYEIRNKAMARKAAAEGMVLLKNDESLLPLKKGSRIALYGSGASKTIKGGTGSGDVNQRESVSIYQGLKNAGYDIATEEWIAAYDAEYEKKRIEWKDSIWAEIDRTGKGVFDVYVSTKFDIPTGNLPEIAEENTDTAVYVLSRVAGEGADRYNGEGDYLLSREEEIFIERISKFYKNIVLIINTGGIVDLSFTDKYSNIKSILYIVQPGMEGGNAVADVLSGDVTPGGKLTDTWAYKYEDYPSSEGFSHNNNELAYELYEEGIYVGYRYFDSFDIPVRYPFGYGMSYTDFEIKARDICLKKAGTKDVSLEVKLSVKNTGDTFSGKEVVQLYVSCPGEKQSKEYRRLAGYKKTKLLKPGESQDITIDVPVYGLASYCEKTPGWVIESGTYGLFVGNSITASEIFGIVNISADKVLVKTKNICPLNRELKEIKAPEDKVTEMRKQWLADCDKYMQLEIRNDDMVTEEIEYGTVYDKVSEDVKAFVDTLTTEELIKLATGELAGGDGANIGSSGLAVPGSAAQTSTAATEKGLASLVLADGPAGLRLMRQYYEKDGEITILPVEYTLENGFIAREPLKGEGNKWYQFCTAFPVGTLIAQTWDDELAEEVGKAVAEELKLFQVTLWLAPGMNIHRNPLCGRNFEYYSEDPFISGKIAAAVTKGVQSMKGYGTTIKHFACNSAEDNRNFSDSIVSERALREIYLKGFEIAVKESAPMAIMTSYNLINGIHAANNKYLCTEVARNEWNYEGLIMTDWATTHNGPECTASGCMRAGNDIIMPGCSGDHENIKKELEEGSLDIKDLKLCIAHFVKCVWDSDRY